MRQYMIQALMPLAQKSAVPKVGAVDSEVGRPDCRRVAGVGGRSPPDSFSLLRVSRDFSIEEGKGYG